MQKNAISKKPDLLFNYAHISILSHPSTIDILADEKQLVGIVSSLKASLQSEGKVIKSEWSRHRNAHVIRFKSKINFDEPACSSTYSMRILEGMGRGGFTYVGRCGTGLSLLFRHDDRIGERFSKGQKIVSVVSYEENILKVSNASETVFKRVHRIVSNRWKLGAQMHYEEGILRLDGAPWGASNDPIEGICMDVLEYFEMENFRSIGNLSVRGAALFFESPLENQKPYEGRLPGKYMVMTFDNSSTLRLMANDELQSIASECVEKGLAKCIQKKYAGGRITGQKDTERGRTYVVTGSPWGSLHSKSYQARILEEMALVGIRYVDMTCFHWKRGVNYHNPMYFRYDPSTQVDISIFSVLVPNAPSSQLVVLDPPHAAERSIHASIVKSWKKGLLNEYSPKDWETPSVVFAMNGQPWADWMRVHRKWIGARRMLTYVVKMLETEEFMWLGSMNAIGAMSFTTKPKAVVEEVAEIACVPTSPTPMMSSAN